MANQTILVTGGAGFIGANFVDLVLREEPDVSVVNLDSLTYSGNLANLSACRDCARHYFVRGDINDGDLVLNLIKTHKVDGIINFAAESHVDRSIANPRIFLETNILGTHALLNAALIGGVRRFLQVSTDEVYGSLPPHGYFTETTPVQPNSPYSASKAAADHLVRAYHHTYGLDTVTTRCSNNYGPFQFPEKMIPLMINNARQNKPLPVYGDGLQVRDWLYVTDHCRAVWKVFQAGASGRVYNIGGNNEKTNLDVVKLILARLGKPESLITFVKDRPGHDRRYAIDASLIAAELGWQPQMDFETGMRLTIDWYLEHQDWLNDVVSGAYQDYYEKMYDNR